ncbi:MAG: DUF1292 domain-containing protein [Clostridia bacterium]|nr:DUF1292 domain-containing protein [Clostridia bacterium]
MDEKSLFDILTDDENYDNIILLDKNGNKTEFEQVAIIPMENYCYAILHPVSKIDGVMEDEVIVFRLDEESGTLILVTDENEAVPVFEEYERMVEEE